MIKNQIISVIYIAIISIQDLNWCYEHHMLISHSQNLRFKILHPGSTAYTNNSAKSRKEEAVVGGFFLNIFLLSDQTRPYSR